MKSSICRIATLLGFLVTAVCSIQAAQEPLVLQATIRSGQIHLRWTGGRPTYPLQTRSRLGEPWANVGSPTTSTSAELPLTSGQAFFRVLPDATAQYEVTFDATWSQETHPGAWPVGAHWSGPIGGVHNDQVRFWREGETASEGIRLMAERGAQGRLRSEVETAIDQGTADFVISGSGIGSPAATRITFPRPMRREFPLVTLCSMIAPSPDWFVGVTGLSLIENGAWVDEKSVVLYGFDAGTDSGTTFTSADEVTTPRGVIARFAGFPALIDGQIVPFGTFTFRRLD